MDNYAKIFWDGLEASLETAYFAREFDEGSILSIHPPRDSQLPILSLLLSDNRSINSNACLYEVELSKETIIKHCNEASMDDGRAPKDIAVDLAAALNNIKGYSTDVISHSNECRFVVTYEGSTPIFGPFTLRAVQQLNPRILCREKDWIIHKNQEEMHKQRLEFEKQRKLVLDTIQDMEGSSSDSIRKNELLSTLDVKWNQYVQKTFPIIHKSIKDFPAKSKRFKLEESVHSAEFIDANSQASQVSAILPTASPHFPMSSSQILASQLLHASQTQRAQLATKKRKIVTGGVCINR